MYFLQFYSTNNLYRLFWFYNFHTCRVRNQIRQVKWSIVDKIGNTLTAKLNIITWSMVPQKWFNKIIPVKFQRNWTTGFRGIDFKGFHIIWPRYLVVNYVKIVLAILVGNHSKIIPVKFKWNWTTGFRGIGFKGFHIIWPRNLIVNRVKVVYEMC